MWKQKKKERKKHKRKIAHMIRESWRRRKFKDWLRSKGRVQELLRHSLEYDEARIQKLRYKFDSSNGTCRAVLAGAVASPACFGEPCLWGCGEPIGSWDHVCWQCEKAPRPTGLETPACPAERRLGWQTAGIGNWKSLDWMAEVAEKIWDKRYDREKQKQLLQARKEKLQLRSDDQNLDVDSQEEADSEEDAE
jgi:hypothetical protein